MTDTMPSGESQPEPDDAAGASDSGDDTSEPAPEEELDDAHGDAEGDTDAGGAAAGDQAGEEPGQPDRQLAKVAGSDPPDPKKLDELDEHIRHARATAEEVVGASDEEPLYAESGAEEPADDQTITPPG